MAGYDIVTPPPYALSTPDPVPLPTCERSYVVASGDSCESVALANSVSVHGIVSRNALAADCRDLRPGRTICLPDTCTIHRVSRTDSCSSLGETYGGITPPGGKIEAGSGDTIDEAVPAPLILIRVRPTRSAEGGTRWFSKTPALLFHRISIAQLRVWNPSLSHDLSLCKLEPDLFYCVSKEEFEEPPFDDGSTFCIREYPVDKIPAGTHPRCNCFTLVNSDLYGETCAEIAGYTKVGLSRLLELNSWLAPPKSCEEELLRDVQDVEDSNGEIHRLLCLGTIDEYPELPLPDFSSSPSSTLAIPSSTQPPLPGTTTTAPGPPSPLSREQ
ncbi:unnamed protein product [Parascedosporium putredinis]|uniref:LysM domain-containing protein n=1 Tax=Parascedosporium putredinis TaxID=1442378 RepID=A0A9P1HBB3_9PEZI|nr:unnamed protein product [Parascedosporium putredinis]CAI8003056.1 unnamed protein product [Parascedosporium putredinis]